MKFGSGPRVVRRSMEIRHLSQFEIGLFKLDNSFKLPQLLLLLEKKRVRSHDGITPRDPDESGEMLG